MTAAELMTALDRLSLTQAEAARRLGVSYMAVWRWTHGYNPIPGPVVAAVNCWYKAALSSASSSGSSLCRLKSTR